MRGGLVADDPATAIVLVGNAGRELWPRFVAGRRDEEHPLDAWTARIVEPIADGLGVRVAYPNDRPWPPFQQWAMRAEPVAPSPIGLLIHPDHGLWHAYRAALLLDHVPPDLPVRADRPSPCATCASRPCLTACPVGAHAVAGFGVTSCATHVRSGDAPRCIEIGCRSRDACPVGTASRFEAAQIAFHMRAFERAV